MGGWMDRKMTERCEYANEAMQECDSDCQRRHEKHERNTEDTGFMVSATEGILDAKLRKFVHAYRAFAPLAGALNRVRG
jgi:hypothetical protein